MKFGEITCKCGLLFYFESATDEVECVGCGYKHDVSMFPQKEDVEFVQEETIDEVIEEETETIADSAK